MNLTGYWLDLSNDLAICENGKWSIWCDDVECFVSKPEDDIDWSYFAVANKWLRLTTEL